DPSQRLDVVLAEDDPDLAAMNRHALTAAGHHVEIARDGVEAIEAVHRADPDLLILDVDMPRANGIEVVEELRGNPATEEQPVVVLTNTELRPDQEDRLRRLGVIDILAKWRVGPLHLVQWLRQWVSQHRPRPRPGPA
ncbi:MAG: response regulator, partial [Candidatus Dormibacteria bacterium]